MPPTGRRRTRKEAEQPSSQDNKEGNMSKATAAAQTGGRNKRRKTNTAQAVVSRDSAETEDTVDNRNVDREIEDPWQHQLQIADRIVASLRTANYEVNAAVQYSNELQKTQDDVTAFARISGRHWSYLVKQTNVLIGRPKNQTVLSHTPGGSTTSMGLYSDTNAPTRQDYGVVQIDLGPDHQISRIHAEISYVEQEAKWKISINGRNGALVNESRLERGDEMWLHSGAVISIMGTQMLFVLPSELLSPSRSVLEQAGLGDETETNVEDDENTNMRRPPPAHAPGPPSNRQLGGNIQSSQNGGQAQQRRGKGPADSQPGTPFTGGSGTTQPRSKPSPAYARGLMMESTEEIDYSHDNAKDLKPPHSYAILIGNAIISSPDGKLTLAKIYDWIKENFAFYRHSTGGWQNSIRHNLSLSKIFEKVARRTDEPGKGMKWQIVANERDDFVKKHYLGNINRRNRRIGSSMPNSPAA
ncbi:hypothetical protein LTS18_012981, partial [Coniosporium uncinatum]